MENPATWTEVERTISAVLKDIHKQEAEDARDGAFRAGASTPALIARALRTKDLIVDGS